VLERGTWCCYNVVSGAFHQNQRLMGVGGMWASAGYPNQSNADLSRGIRALLPENKHQHWQEVGTYLLRVPGLVGKLGLLTRTSGGKDVRLLDHST
jgi:hypothetical protein